MNVPQEGVYQWLAINYVLGKFKYIHRETPEDNGNGDGHHEVAHSRPRTVGAIDMGGASMQFAMEVTKDISVRTKIFKQCLLTLSPPTLSPPSITL